MTTTRRNFSRRRTRHARPVRHVHRAGYTPRYGSPAPVPQRGLRGAHTGLVYMKNRWYSPTLGRFLQRDPIAEDGGVNLYAYCGNEPVGRADPLGLDDGPQVIAADTRPERMSPAALAAAIKWNREEIEKIIDRTYFQSNPIDLTPHIAIPFTDRAFDLYIFRIPSVRTFPKRNLTNWERTEIARLEAEINEWQRQEIVKTGGTSEGRERLNEALRQAQWDAKNGGAMVAMSMAISPGPAPLPRSLLLGPGSPLTPGIPYGVNAVRVSSVNPRAPVTGSQWYEYFAGKYGAENVGWSRLPAYVKGGPTSGVLATSVGDIDLVSGYGGPSAAMKNGMVPGMNWTLRSHVEAHTASAMRQLGLNDATLYLNRLPCEWGVGNGCENMLPRMLGEGRSLRVVVPGQLDRIYIGVAP